MSASRRKRTRARDAPQDAGIAPHGPSDDAVWAAIVDPLLTARSAAELLGVDEHTIRVLERDRRILALHIGDTTGYPAAQFDAGRILPGIADILHAMPHTDMTDVVFWLLAPDHDGVRQIEILRAGDTVEVLRRARHDAAVDDP